MSTSTLVERWPLRALSQTQLAALSAMEIVTYVRRRTPPAAAPTASLTRVWPAADMQSALARALAQAVGATEPSGGMEWLLAQGMQLPDLGVLRGDGRAKRELWRSMRSRLRPASA